MASDTSTLQFSRLQLARALKEDLNDENAPPAETSVIFLQTRNKRNNGLPDVKIPSHFHVPKPPNLIVPQPLAQVEAGQKQRQPPASKPRASRPQPLNTNARDSIAIFGDAPLLEGNNGPSTLLDARKTYIQTRHSHVQPLFSPVSSQRTSQLMHHRSSSTDSLKKNFAKPQTTSRLATVPPISVIRDDSSSISSDIQLPSPVTMSNYSPSLHPRERLSSSSQSSSGLVVTTPTDNYSPSRASRPSSRPPSRPPSRPQSVSNHMRVNSNGPNSPTILQPSMSSRPSSLNNNNQRPPSIYKYNPPPDSETEDDDQSSEKESSSSSDGEEEEEEEEEETKNTKGNNNTKPTKKGKESEYKLDITLPKLELMLSSEEEASEKETTKVNGTTRKSLTTLDIVEEAPSHEEESSEGSSDEEEDDEEDEESSDDDTPLALKETAPPKINIEPVQSHKNRRLSAWLTDVSEKSILPLESPVKKESHGFLHPRKLSLSSFGLGSNGNDNGHSSPRSRPPSRPSSNGGDRSPNQRLSVAIDQKNVGNRRRPQSMVFQEELLPPSPQFVVGSRRRSNSDHTTPRRSRPRSGIYPPMLDPVSISSTKESDFWAKDTLLALSDDYKSLGSLAHQFNNHRSSTPTPKNELYIHSSGNRSSSSALNKALFKHNNQRDGDYNKTHRRDSSDEITLGELRLLRKGHHRDGSGESSGSGSPLASQATRSGDSLNNGFSSSSSGSPRTPVIGAGVGSYFPQQSRRRSSHDNAGSHRGSVPPSPRNRV